MKFAYRARDQAGQIKVGEVIASDESRAEQLLEENGLTIVSIQQRQGDILDRLNPFGHSVNNKDLVMYSRQLATLISARVPILQSLRILEEQISSKYLLLVTKDIVASIENGESLSAAMSKHSEVFGNVYISLVKSGEASGSLDKSLVYLADQLEKDYELIAKVKTAMTYPTFILIAMVAVIGFMFKFIMPNLIGELEQQGGSLPTITIYLIAITNFINVYWWAILLGLAVAILGIRFYVASPYGKRQMDFLKINLPILGDIFQKIYLARFARNLSTLVKGGIPIIKALEIVSDVINNSIYRDILLEAVTQIQAGKSISDGLVGHQKEFPSLVSQMVRVGEQTAQLDDILGKLASFYEKEVDAKVSTLTTLLEPIIMIVLGLGVGVLVAGILMPIYNMSATAG